MKELAAPMLMPDMEISFTGSNGCYPIDIDVIANALTQVGRPDLRSQWLAGQEFSLQLYRDASAIMVIFGTDSMPVWCLSQQEPITMDRNVLLGYTPIPAKHVTLCEPVALTLYLVERLMQREDGSWYSAGYQCRIVGDYVRNLWTSELRDPGGYRKLIKAYRAAIATAPALPPGTKMVVDATGEIGDHYRRRLREFTHKFPVTSTSRGFEVEVTPDNLHDLAILRSSQTKIISWVVPEEPVAEAAPPARRMRP